MSCNPTYKRRIWQDALARYFAACLAAGVAVLAGWWVRPHLGEYGTYMMLCAAVAFAAMYCGLGASILSAVAGLVATRFVVVSHTNRFEMLSAAQWAGMLIFAGCCGVIVAIGEANRRKTRALLDAHDDLEDRVVQRTAELDKANSSLRELTGQLLHLQDEERRRISRELHDSVGQGLTALAMNLATVKRELDRVTKAAATITESSGLVNEISADIRTISYLLHPPLLDEAGLVAALRWYTNGFAERSGIQVKLRCPEDFERLPQEVETAVFRVVQECLTNIHRHSESRHANIHIDKSERELLVQVEDGGKGISLDKRQEMASGGTTGVGVRGMRERVQQLGGKLEFGQGRNGKGTVVTMRLPVRDAASGTRHTVADSATQSDAARETAHPTAPELHAPPEVHETADLGSPPRPEEPLPPLPNPRHPPRPETPPRPPDDPHPILSYS